MKRIGIIGDFGINDSTTLGGQDIKTKSVTAALKDVYDREQIITLNTHNGLRDWNILIFNTFKTFYKCENIIFLPAHNGLRIFSILFTIYNIFFRRKLIYVVIGGWLPDFLQNRKWLKHIVKKFNSVVVETSTMKHSLVSLGLKNVTIMPNFKKLQILTNDQLNYEKNLPHKLCSFSRVIKKKGIEDAIHVINLINNIAEKTIFTFDIYGPIDNEYKTDFEKLLQKCPPYISYKGIVEPDKSVDIIKNYFLLLFPTQYFTEGIPGTIIDAYAAGTPVVASKWESFHDVIDQNITGFGYDFMDINKFKDTLLYISYYPDIVLNMKKNCIKKANKFMPNEGIKILTEIINNKRK